MHTITSLLAIADAYKSAAGVELDRTVSHRVFGDSKKLTALRNGSDITVGRFNHALDWFAANWPVNHPRPEVLSAASAPQNDEKGAA